MAHSRVITAFFAAIACTTLPGSASAQRAVEYQPLRLTGTVPIRMAWRPSDLALAGGFTVALLVDAAQTRRLARGGWRDYHETNPLLGPRPSVGQVNTYTAVVGLSVLGLAAVAPKRARSGLLGVALAVEAYALAAMSGRGVAITF
jgi:hypothetical protein